MEAQLLEVKRERFHLLEDNRYLLQGNWPKNYDLKAFLDKTEIQASMEPWESLSALERFKESELLLGEKVTVSVFLPENLDRYRRLFIYAVAGGERLTWFQISVKELKAKQGKPQFYLEEER